jgi:2-polyprenyl-6-methoxyphenol hydroxylase-like FAD-dependent oxidoreductase
MSRGTREQTRAIVIGGSIAGLLTARVLSEFFEQVTVVDRDQFPPAGKPRRGVPQSVQPHVLFTRGYRILEELFPGIGNDLKSAGAIPIDWGKEFHYFTKGAFNATVEEGSGLVSFTCTRPLLEGTVRNQVAQVPNIEWLEGSRVCGLIGSREQVKGIRYRISHHGEEQHLLATLVVDASGRSTHAPDWLEAIGAPKPAATVVNPFLGYATQRMQIPEGWQAGWKVLLIAQEAPYNKRLGYLAEVEGGEWIATLGGYSKDYPPLDYKGFLEFAQSLAHPAFYDAIRMAEPVSTITAHRATANRLYHYEKIQVPEGFAGIGDAVCALCPVYGQGMTVSAISVLELQEWLKQQFQTGDPLKTAEFQKKLAKSLQFPWNIATGSDLQFPMTEGVVPSNPIAGLFQKYVERLIQKSKQEGWIHVRFTEVAHMLKPPTAFFAPQLILEALTR